MAHGPAAWANAVGGHHTRVVTIFPAKYQHMKDEKKNFNSEELKNIKWILLKYAVDMKNF